jgi:hypothetical protein
MDLLREFNKSQSEYNPTAASLGKLFYDNYLSLSAIDNDIRPNATSSARPPSQHALLHSSFGKPSASHSFVQDACFKTSYVLALKSGFFEPVDILDLHGCHPLLSHLLCACIYLRHCDFLWLTQYNLDWDKQQSLSRQGIRLPRMSPPLQPERCLNHLFPRQQLHRHLSQHPVDHQLSSHTWHSQVTDITLITPHDRGVPQPP